MNEITRAEIKELSDFKLIYLAEVVVYQDGFAIKINDRLFKGKEGKVRIYKRLNTLFEQMRDFNITEFTVNIENWEG